MFEKELLPRLGLPADVVKTWWVSLVPCRAVLCCCWPVHPMPCTRLLNKRVGSVERVSAMYIQNFVPLCGTTGLTSKGLL